MTKKNRIVLQADSLSTVGDYIVDGQILILPIKGNGKSNITMGKLMLLPIFIIVKLISFTFAVDVDLSIDFVGVPYEKDGASYMKADQIKMTIDTKKMFYKVDNLFNGDKELGDNMNLFLNENWQEIFFEVRDSLGNAYSSVFGDVINGVFSKYPYEKYFTD